MEVSCKLLMLIVGVEVIGIWRGGKEYGRTTRKLFSQRIQ
jgi:hypothetical protein